MPDVNPTVVLCCTKNIRHLLPPVLEAFAARGLVAEVVSGLEQRDDAPLGAAQRHPDARFVLFSGSGPAVLERARTKLRYAGVPASCITAMPMEWRGPADVIAAVEAMGVAMAPAPRRTTLGAVLDPAASVFPPPQAGEPEQPRQPLLSGSVAVLEGATIEDDFGARRRRVIVGASAAALAVAITLGLAIGGDEEEPEAQPDLASLRAAWARVKAYVAPPAAASTGEAIAVAGVVPTPSAPAPAPMPAVVAPIAAPPTIAAPPIAVAPTVPPSAAVPPPPEEEIVLDEAAEPEIDSEEMAAIYAGLVSQRFRALDILLIAPEPRKKVRKRLTKHAARMSWAQADAYCKALDVGGVADWRLPRVGELGSITRGELIADGKFWSQTEGDTFGKTRVVWNTHTSRMGTAPTKWKGGRVVCVRTMARPPELPEGGAAPGPATK